MKQVVLNDVVPSIITINNLPTEGYYIMKLREMKGFLTRERHRGGLYVWRSLDGITEGNGWSVYSRNTIKSAIEVALDNHFEVFYTDSEEEFKEFLLK